MKSTLKIFGLFFLAVSLHSCSTGEESTEETALEKELTLQNDGVLKVASTTYVFKPTGETVKFNLENREFDFRFEEAINYRVVENEMKHEDAEWLIENPDTDEFIILSHFEVLSNGNLQFDVELSTGDRFFSVIYQPKKGAVVKSGKWHDMWPVVEDPALVLQAFTEPSASNGCKAAVAACERGGGRAVLALTHARGWFTPAQACKVECN